MILVDSNIWAYYIDSALDEHHRVRSNLPGLLRDREVVVPAIVQIEVVHYITRQVPDEAEALIDTFLAQPGPNPPLSAGTVTEAARLLIKHGHSGLGGRDASILVTAKREGATLATHDATLASVARDVGVTFVDPAA